MVAINSRISLLKKRWYICFICLVSYILIRISFTTMVNRYSHMQEIKKLYENLIFNMKENFVLDNSGMYKIFNTKKPNNSTKLKHDITLVTQCSFNHLQELSDLLEIWTGPISVAVYTEAEFLEKTLWNVAKISICNKHRDLRLNIVVPNDVAFDEYLNAISNSSKNSIKWGTCDSYEVPDAHNRQNYNWSSLYPINLLRNVAKKSSSTFYFVVIDIDMIPSWNFRSSFLAFARKKRFSLFKEVYVVPVFEILPDVPMPADKQELREKFRSKEARQFYLQPCPKCHELTNYKNWFVEDFSLVRVLFQVNWVHPWEPFFIARYNIPDFDERFKQYGMNRVSQICELHVAGYSFLIVNNLFLLHKGFKTMEGFHVTKEKEMERNRKLYARFRAEVKLKYLNSTRTCLK